MTIAQAVELAVKHHQSGDFSEAESIYKQVLQADPNQPDALHLLGLIERQKGRADLAVELIQKAIVARPEFTEAYCNLGNTLKDLGQMDAAVEKYQKAISINPSLPEAHFNLANAFYDLGKLDAAVTSYTTAIKLRPNYTQAHSNLGNVFKSLKRFDESGRAYQKAIEVDPNYAEAYSNWGQLLIQEGKFDAAMKCFDRAVALNPNYIEAICNKGVAFGSIGRFSDAISMYDMALSINPNFAAAVNNKGNALRSLGRFDEAITSYKHALSIDPKFAKSLCNLGSTLLDMNNPVEAMNCYRKAIDLQPDYAEAYLNMSSALSAQGQIEKAREYMDEALELSPETVGWQVRKALMMPVISSSVDEYQRYRDELRLSVETITNECPQIDDPYHESGTVNFRLSYGNENNKELMQSIAQMHLATCPELAFIAPHCQEHVPESKKRLRIGFISSNLRNHTIGKLNAGMIEYFSRDLFDVIVIRAPGRTDDMAMEIDDSADEVVHLSGQLVADRQRVADQKLDILFYLDIGLAPYTYYLSFSRLAPVQAVTWGHPDTTGVPNMDYFISSELMEPEGAEAHYSERLIKLDLMPTYYKHPKAPDASVIRKDFQLPLSGQLYVCPQTLFKFDPDFDLVLKEILDRDPDGYLVLIADPAPEPWRQCLSARFERSLGDVFDRVIFVPHMSEEKYLGLLSLADAMIDIPLFSGGNSSLEAFAMDTPIVTWPGAYMRGRVTAGYYKQMGVGDLIASNQTSYVELALKLAQNAAFKKGIQSKIIKNRALVFDRADVVGEIEQVFISAYEEWRVSSK